MAAPEPISAEDRAIIANGWRNNPPADRARLVEGLYDLGIVPIGVPDFESPFPPDFIRVPWVDQAAAEAAAGSGVPPIVIETTRFRPDTLWDRLLRFLDGIWNRASSAVAGAGNAILDVPSRIFNAARRAAEAAGGSVVQAYQAARDTIAGVVASVAPSLSGIAGAIGSALAALLAVLLGLAVWRATARR